MESARRASSSSSTACSWRTSWASVNLSAGTSTARSGLPTSVMLSPGHATLVGCTNAGIPAACRVASTICASAAVFATYATSGGGPIRIWGSSSTRSAPQSAHTAIPGSYSVLQSGHQGIPVSSKGLRINGVSPYSTRRGQRTYHRVRMESQGRSHHLVGAGWRNACLVTWRPPRHYRGSAKATYLPPLGSFCRPLLPSAFTTTNSRPPAM